MAVTSTRSDHLLETPLFRTSRPLAPSCRRTLPPCGDWVSHPTRCAAPDLLDSAGLRSTTFTCIRSSRLSQQRCHQPPRASPSPAVEVPSSAFGS